MSDQGSPGLAASARELFGESAQLLIWLVSGAVAVLIGLFTALFPKLRLPAWLWLVVFVVGSALAILRAFHRVRLERDTLLEAPVDLEHLELLRSHVQAAINCVANDRRSPEAGPSEVPPAMFGAHFPDLILPLRDWDRAVERSEVAPRRLRERFGREIESRSLDAAPYIGDVLASRLAEFVLRLSLEGRLDDPLDLSVKPSGYWQGFANGSVLFN